MLHLVADRPCVDPDVAFVRRPDGRLWLSSGALQHEVAFRAGPSTWSRAVRGAALALALVGCSGPSEPTTASAASPPTSIATPATAIPDPLPPTSGTDEPTAVAQFDALLDDGPRGRFRLDDASIEATGEGALDRQVVVRMIQTRRAALQACYERALRSDPTSTGRVVAQMTIETSGTVSDAQVGEASSDPSVGVCVARVLRGFRFHPGPEGGSVTYTIPFVFEPQS